MCLAFIMDMLVWKAASRIDMNPEDEDLPAPDAAPLAPLPAPAPASDTQL